MNDNGDTPEDDDLNQLLAGVGKRPEPPAGTRERAYTALKATWTEQVRTRHARTRRRLLYTFSAVSAAVLATVMWFAFEPAATKQTWAVELAHGALVADTRTFDTAQALSVKPGDVWSATSTVRLETDNGTQIRLSEGSEIRWLDRQSIFMSNGSAYLDTHNMTQVVVGTPYGEVRNLGTRFMIESDSNGMLVAVREGTAQVESEFGRHTATADTLSAALLQIDEGGVAQTSEPASDERWDWIHAANPGYTDRTVPAVLRQIARDLGKTLRFSSQGVEAAIAYDRVQGQLTNMQPRQALELVTKSAGLAWQEDGTNLTIYFIRDS